MNEYKDTKFIVEMNDLLAYVGNNRSKKEVVKRLMGELTSRVLAGAQIRGSKGRFDGVCIDSTQECFPFVIRMLEMEQVGKVIQEHYAAREQDCADISDEELDEKTLAEFDKIVDGMKK